MRPIGFRKQLPFLVLHHIRVPLPSSLGDHLRPFLVTQCPIPLAKRFVIVLVDLEWLTGVAVGGHDGSVCDIWGKGKMWIQDVVTGAFGGWLDFPCDVGS